MVTSLDDEAMDHWLENEVGVNRKNLRETIIGKTPSSSVETSNNEPVKIMFFIVGAVVSSFVHALDYKRTKTNL